MKPPIIFKQCAWLVNVLRRRPRQTLAELQQRWLDDDAGDGRPLSRTTFNRHRDAILDMFGVIISCGARDGYRYFVENPEVLRGSGLEHFVLNALTVGGLVSDSVAVRDSILLEEIPAGEEFLADIIGGLKKRRKLRLEYQRFEGERYHVVVAPYALKLFHQRWYLLGHNGRYLTTYALDRVVSLSRLEEGFQREKGFSAEAYFTEYFGVLTDGTPLERVVVRAYGPSVNYVRTLPLHHSQREVATEEGWSDFACRIRPTYDFRQAILALGDEAEVLEPASLRADMEDMIGRMAEKYRRR